MKKNTPKKSPNKKKEKSKDKPIITSEEIDTKIPIPEPEPASLVPRPKEKNDSKEKDENQKKLEEILKDADKTSKYDFNLHKHLKENIKFKDKQCKDGLSKETSYCLECKLSTCPNCALFKIHSGHPLIQKYPYYICDDNLINEHFTDIDTILKINPYFLNANKVKEELKNHVNNSLDILQNKLNEIRKSKISEIEKMFEKTENCVETLKKKIIKLKEDIKTFFEKQKKFLCINVKEKSNINGNSPQTNQVIENLKEGSESNVGYINRS